MGVLRTWPNSKKPSTLKTTFGFLNLMSLKTWPWERHLSAIIPLFTMSFELSAMSCELRELIEQQLEGDQDQNNAAEDFHAVGESL